MGLDCIPHVYPCAKQGTAIMVDNEIDYGLQTMCEGGGMANATILERIR